MAQAGPTIADVVFPDQLNHRGTLFGGAAIALMDRAAFVAASREARTDVVCAGADAIVFTHPIAPGDLVEATAAVERRGRRSMTVSVVVVAEALRTGERREAVRGTFHMVAAEPLETTAPGPGPAAGGEPAPAAGVRSGARRPDTAAPATVEEPSPAAGTRPGAPVPASLQSDTHAPQGETE